MDWLHSQRKTVLSTANSPDNSHQGGLWHTSGFANLPPNLKAAVASHVWLMGNILDIWPAVVGHKFLGLMLLWFISSQAVLIGGSRAALRKGGLVYKYKAKPQKPVATAEIEPCYD